MGLVPKLLGTGGDAVVISRHGFATAPGPEGKGAVVREEDLAVVLQVVPHLRAALKGGEVGIERLDLDDAALGLELEERGGVRAVLFEFLRGEEAAIRDARAVVRGVNDGSDFRLQGVADGIEEL